MAQLDMDTDYLCISNSKKIGTGLYCRWGDHEVSVVPMEGNLEETEEET